MKELLKMPPLGEGDIEGVVAAVPVSVGDEIDHGVTLVEVETDKVVVEVPAASAGIVEEILIREGDKVTEGVDFMRIMPAGEKAANEETRPFASSEAALQNVESDTAPVSQPGTATSEPLVMPALGEGDIEGVISALHVSAGESLAAETTVMEVETDKVVVEVPLPCEGIIDELLVSTGDKVRGGQVYAHFRAVCSGSAESAPVVSIPSEDRADAEQPESAKAKEDGRSASTSVTVSEAVGVSRSGKEVNAGPSVRRMAREIGVELAQLTGTGPRRRITKEDVQNYAKQAIQRSQQASLTPSVKPLPDFSAFGSVRRETMTGIQVATADNMSNCWSQIPHFWLQEKIDITDLEALRQKHKARVKSVGGSLTLTAIIVKALAHALQEFPVFNSAFDAENQEIVYRDYIDIGVAVDTERGLVVPSLRAADSKTLTEIAIELGTLAQQAKDRKLGAKDLAGAGFPLSNLGGMGLSSIFPIVSWPQVAILGVAASSYEPVLIDGEFVPRLMMPVTMGLDHRVINGADGARFLALLKALLEDTFTLLL